MIADTVAVELPVAVPVLVPVAETEFFDDHVTADVEEAANVAFAEAESEGADEPDAVTVAVAEEELVPESVAV